MADVKFHWTDSYDVTLEPLTNEGTKWVASKLGERRAATGLFALNLLKDALDQDGLTVEITRARSRRAGESNEAYWQRQGNEL